MNLNRLVLITSLLLSVSSAPAQNRPGETPGSGADFAVQFQHALEQYVNLPTRPIGAAATEQALQDWRRELGPLLERLIRELETLAQRAGSPPDVLLVKALAHIQQANLVLDARRMLDREYASQLDAVTANPSDANQSRLAGLAGERALLAERSAEEYRTVERVLSEALDAADALRDRREVSLVRGVILAQSAIVRDRAIDAVQDADRQIEVDGAALRKLLDDAEVLLKDYLAATSKDAGLAWVRGYFYLGVVQYRRSLKMRVPDQEYFTEVDPARIDAFEAAREIFTELSDPSTVFRLLHPHAAEEAQATSAAGRAYESSSFRLQSNYSYEAVANYYAATANMYLGLIAALDPGMEEQAPESRLPVVQGFMDRAVELDYSRPQPGEPEISLTVGTIPLSSEKVLKGLTESLTAVQERMPLNDLTFSFGAAAIYDTNVPLLGRNTEAPLDKRRKRDFRVGTQFRMEYVADLDAFAPGNPELKKWQLLLEGRVTPVWNARIHDFNEQLYGGTINLRYELLGYNTVENIDGVYLHNRYDYDYILLGNDGFLKINRLRPSLQVVAFDQMVDASVYFNYEDRNYLEVLADERFDRDGNYYAFGLDGRIDLRKWVDADRLWGEQAWGRWGPSKDDRDYVRPLEFYWGLEFGTNSTQGTEFDYENALFTLGSRVPLPWGIDFLISGLWEWQDYRGNSLIDFHRRGRDDFIQEYAFGLERRFYLTQYDRNFEFTEPLKLQRLVMTLFGDIRFTLDDSNVRDRLGQSIFEYNRVIYRAGVRFDIN